MFKFGMRISIYFFDTFFSRDVCTNATYTPGSSKWLTNYFDRDFIKLWMLELSYFFLHCMYTFKKKSFPSLCAFNTKYGTTLRNKNIGL